MMSFNIPGKLGGVLAYEMRYGHLPPPLIACTPPCVVAPPPPDLPPEEITSLEAFLADLPSNGIDGDESDAMEVMDFSICVEIRAADDAVDDVVTEDNKQCSPIVITLPREPGKPYKPELGGYEPEWGNKEVGVDPFGRSGGFSTTGGGSAFSFGVDFSAAFSADYQGYLQTINAAIPVTVFGVTGNFIEVDHRFQLVPDYPGKSPEDYSQFITEISFVGTVLAVIDLPPGTSYNKDIEELSFSKQFPDPEGEATILVGPGTSQCGRGYRG